jgi:hypothetical protein
MYGQGTTVLLLVNVIYMENGNAILVITEPACLLSSWSISHQECQDSPGQSQAHDTNPLLSIQSCRLIRYAIECLWWQGWHLVIRLAYGQSWRLRAQYMHVETTGKVENRDSKSQVCHVKYHHNCCIFVLLPNCKKTKTLISHNCVWLHSIVK